MYNTFQVSKLRFLLILTSTLRNKAEVSKGPGALKSVGGVQTQVVSDCEKPLTQMPGVHLTQRPRCARGNAAITCLLSQTRGPGLRTGRHLGQCQPHPQAARPSVFSLLGLLEQAAPLQVFHTAILSSDL